MKKIKIKGLDELICYEKLDNGLEVYLFIYFGFELMFNVMVTIIL